MTTMPNPSQYRRFPGRGNTALAMAACVAAALSLCIREPADAYKPSPLPPDVVAQAPGIHPLGHGKRKVWGFKVYHATLWVCGRSWSASEPHAVELKPSRTIPANTLIDAALEEMRELNLGNESRLQTWRQEMTQLVPNVKDGDRFVIFCPTSGKTLVYLDGHRRGEVDDTTRCPAIMGIWLNPASSQQELRRKLLKQ